MPCSRQVTVARSSPRSTCGAAAKPSIAAKLEAAAVKMVRGLSAASRASSSVAWRLKMPMVPNCTTSASA